MNSSVAIPKPGGRWFAFDPPVEPDHPFHRAYFEHMRRLAVWLAAPEFALPIGISTSLVAEELMLHLPRSHEWWAPRCQGHQARLTLFVLKEAIGNELWERVLNWGRMGCPTQFIVQG